MAGTDFFSVTFSYTHKQRELFFKWRVICPDVKR